MKLDSTHKATEADDQIQNDPTVFFYGRWLTLIHTTQATILVKSTNFLGFYYILKNIYHNISEKFPFFNILNDLGLQKK